MGERTVQAEARENRFDRILFIFLTAILLVATVAVSWQMFTPSNRAAVEASLIQDGLAIISAAQTWVNHLPYETTDEQGPFSLLRYDRIGYFDGVLADGRTMINEHGRYTLIVAPDGSRFSLLAEGPDKIQVQWRDVGIEGVPEPKKQ